MNFRISCFLWVFLLPGLYNFHFLMNQLFEFLGFLFMREVTFPLSNILHLHLFLQNSIVQWIQSPMFKLLERILFNYSFNHLFIQVVLKLKSCFFQSLFNKIVVLLLPSSWIGCVKISLWFNRRKSLFWLTVHDLSKLIFLNLFLTLIYLNDFFVERFSCFLTLLVKLCLYFVGIFQFFFLFL